MDVIFTSPDGTQWAIGDDWWIEPDIYRSPTGDDDDWWLVDRDVTSVPTEVIDKIYDLIDERIRRGYYEPNVPPGGRL